jgi:hypothetical protein
MNASATVMFGIAAYRISEPDSDWNLDLAECTKCGATLTFVFQPRIKGECFASSYQTPVAVRCDCDELRRTPIPITPHKPDKPEDQLPERACADSS